MDIQPKLLSQQRRQEIIERITALYTVSQVTGGVAKELAEIAIELLVHIRAVELTNETLLNAIGIYDDSD